MKVIRMTNNENESNNNNMFNNGADKIRVQPKTITNSTNIKNPEKKIQQFNETSNQKKILRSFRRIGRCLNKINIQNIQAEKFSKVCLILINNVGQDKNINKVGELNDGYLFGLYHNRLGFKVFYLINRTQSNYLMFFRLFVQNTKDNLTIVYSGAGNTIDFNIDDQSTINSQMNEEKCKIVFISDCKMSRSISDAQNENSREIISFTINNIMHGVFIYYYCKTIFNDTNITLKMLLKRLNLSLERYKESFESTTSNKLNQNEPIYKNCIQCACDLNDDFIDDDDDFEDQN